MRLLTRQHRTSGRITLLGAIVVASVTAASMPASATTAPSTAPPISTTTTTEPTPTPMPATRAAAHILTTSTVLSAGDPITSGNGRYMLSISVRCRLMLSNSTSAIWVSSNTPLSGGCSYGFAAVEADGTVALYAAPYTNPVWTNGVAAGKGSYLKVTNSATLAEKTEGGLNAWTSTGGATGNSASTLAMGQALGPGKALFSTNGAYMAVMGTDGNFYIAPTNGGPATWMTGTWGHAGAELYLRPSDSSLLVVSSLVDAPWSAGTAGMIGTQVTLGTQGTLRYYGPVGQLWNNYQGVVWTMPTNVGVYAYGDGTRADCAYYSQPLCDGWPIIGITGGLGLPAAPWVDTTSGADFDAGQAIYESGRSVPWLSFWTVSGKGCGSTWLRNYSIGLTAGKAVAARIDSYAGRGLPLKPSYVILDPEGYPDDHSGHDIATGKNGRVTAADIANWAVMLEGWSAGIHSVDPSLTPAFYSSMYEYQTYDLRSIKAISTDTDPGASIPDFLAVAFGSSGSASNPLADPSPISSAIPYGQAEVAASNVRGLIAFFAGVPSSVECSGWTGVAAQVLANWGAALNTLQFDPGTTCPA